MDANGKAPSRVAEMSMSEKTSANGGDVVIQMPSEETSKVARTRSTGDTEWNLSKDSESTTPKQLTTVDSLGKGAPPTSHPSPEMARSSPSPSLGQIKPPEVPTTKTLTRRRSLMRSAYSKPKSRFGEQSYSVDLGVDVLKGRERDDGQGADSPNNRAPSRTVSASQSHEKVDDHQSNSKEKKRKRVKTKVLVECVAVGCILGCLVASLTVEKLENSTIWDLEIWKWCTLATVIFCGLVFTNWVMRVLVYLIETNFLLKKNFWSKNKQKFLLKKKALYFFYGMKKSVQVFIWLALVLLTWVLLFDCGVERSPEAAKILNRVTWTIVAFLIGAFLWLLKTLLLKTLASSFHVNTFFDRIKQSVFHLYVLQSLSGRPLAERVEKRRSARYLSLKKGKKGKEKEQLLDMSKLDKMKQEKVSASTMKVLVDFTANSEMSTIVDTLNESVGDGGDVEVQGMAAAKRIFKNVVPNGCECIGPDDLTKFLSKEDAEYVFELVNGAKKTDIQLTSLTDWVVKVYKDHQALAYALNDTKTGVKQLNKLFMGVVIVVSSVVWLLLMEIATTKVLLVLSSQLVVAAVMFGNTCKTIFEAIIFVFVMHPFDVGDRCVIDGVQLVVEEMNILTTVFLKIDNEKVYYPNSVLSTKPISNFYRSPDMGDNVEFCLDFSTSVEKIGELKEKIKEYLEENSQHWHRNHNLVVKEFENVNKIKMVLFFNHKMNFQDFVEKTKRRSTVVMELKRIFEELDIKYNLLPQDVRLTNVTTATAR